MKRLAFIFLLYTCSLEATYCQPPTYNIANFYYIQTPPVEGFQLGCEVMEFKWHIYSYPVERDAQIFFINQLYELVSIEWEETYGIPEETIETYWDATLQQTMKRIRIDSFYEEDEFGNSLEAQATVKLRQIRKSNGAVNRITFHAKPSFTTEWGDIGKEDPRFYGEVLSGSALDEINASRLLNVNNACSGTPAQVYHIKSDLIIDLDYCFRGSNSNKGKITLAPGVNIIVNEGINLDISNYEITSCENTWGSILLKEGATLTVNKTLIEDANLAIHQLEGTNVTIIDSDIEACQSGIRSEGGSTLFLKNSTITNTPASGRGSIAVELVEHQFASFSLSHIEHFEDGILGKNTHVQFDRSSVHDMEAGQNTNGTGIHLEGFGYGTFSNITGDRNNGTGRVNFKDCITGVKVIGQRVNIESNVMHAMVEGVRMENSNNHRQKIVNNEIKASNYGIYLTMNPGAIGEILNNEIHIIAGGETAQASCIRMDNTGPGWFVKQNSFYIEEGTYGVRSNLNSVTRLLDNYFQVPNDKPAYGIFATNDVSPKLQCNIAEGTLSSHITHGFYLNNNSNYLASCNSTIGLTNGIFFNGTNTGMNKLSGNDLSGLYGLTVGDEGSRCDMQFNRGNCFNNTDARLIENTFEAGRNSQIEYNNDPQNGGSPCFEPVNIYGPDNWFREEYNPEFSCVSNFLICSTPDNNAPDPGVCDSESYIHTIDSPRVWTYNQEAQQMYAELAIYHTLRLADCQTPAPTLDSLLSAHQGDVWDAYVSYQEAMASTSDAQLDHDSILQAYQWERGVWFDSLGTLYSDTSYYDSSAVQVVLGQIAQCDSVIHSRDSILGINRNSFIAWMDSILNVPTPSNLHETRLINILRIHNNVYKEDSTRIVLATSDSMYLDSIAGLCIYESGKAGAIARSILSYFRPDEHYDDDSLCVPLQYLARTEMDSSADKRESFVPQSAVARSNIKVSPNPTEGDWRIELSGAAQGRIKLMDLRGQVLREMNINSVTTRIPSSGLPTGMYLLQWTDAQGNVEVHKLYVQ